MRRYRLLETTRAYALEKLIKAGEFDTVARRHARRYLDLFEGAEAEAETRPTDEWLADYVPRIDNVRAALDWAFSPAGDASIGVALTAAAVPLWMHLSLMEECRGRVERALAAIAAGVGRGRTARDAAPRGACGIADVYQRCRFRDRQRSGRRPSRLRSACGDAEYQLRSLWGLWSFRINTGQQSHRSEPGSTLPRSGGKAVRPERSPDRRANDRYVAVLPGRFAQRAAPSRARARPRCRSCPEVAKSFAFEVDQWTSGAGLPCPDPVAAGIAGSGDADRRKQRRGRSGDQSRNLGGPGSRPGGMPDRAVDGRSGRGGTITWKCCSTIRPGTRSRAGTPLAAAIRERSSSSEGDLNAGLRLLRAAFDEPAAAGSVSRFFTFVMAGALGRAGQIADGLAAIEEAIVHSERTEERWLIAELLRVKGELLLLQGGPATRAWPSVSCWQAATRARRQGALAWELRCATSLARLWRDQARRAEAADLLKSVYGRFSEGFDTADLRTAKALLDGLL